MSSREKILERIQNNQPELSPLPDIGKFKVADPDILQKYMSVFRSINGEAYLFHSLMEIKTHIRQHFDVSKRVVTNLPAFTDVAGLYSTREAPHTFQDVELAVIKAPLAVAENGAVWITDDIIGQRIIPYICQHLAVIVPVENIVSTMHDAYAWIGDKDYGFGGFIGGPSKTADIEQALVLGAHGPLTMTVFLVKTAGPNF